MWDKWDDGECSKSCGGGEKNVQRNKKVEAANGGKECSGPSNILETCNVQQCPGMFSCL